MKKQILNVAAIFALAFGITACGGNKNAENSDAAETAAVEETAPAAIEEVAIVAETPDSTFALISGPVDDKGYTTTDSGLKYKVIKEGTGTRPGATDNVTVHYTGTLMDGTKFDSSVDREEPTSFPLNRVIPGWTEGLQLMKEGAVYDFIIPANIAYGDRDMGVIPPNSTLFFQVQLIKVN